MIPELAVIPVRDVRDGGATVDQIVCGAGTDTFDADPADTRSGCETAGLL